MKTATKTVLAMFVMLIGACGPVSVDITEADRSCQQDDDCRMVSSADICSGCLDDAIARAGNDDLFDELSSAKDACVFGINECLVGLTAVCNDGSCAAVAVTSIP